MRFASSRSSRPRLRELVAALDDEVPVAQTWRLVAETAVNLGLPRPSYPHVRRLVGDERRRRRAREQLRDVVRETAIAIAAGHPHSFDYSLGRILDAQAAVAAEEACVSETQGG